MYTALCRAHSWTRSFFQSTKTCITVYCYWHLRHTYQIKKHSDIDRRHNEPIQLFFECAVNVNIIVCVKGTYYVRSASILMASLLRQASDTKVLVLCNLPGYRGKELNWQFPIIECSTFLEFHVRKLWPREVAEHLKEELCW